MKNLKVLTILIAFVFASCSTSKVAKQNEMSFKGDWTLDQVVSDLGNNVSISKIFNHSSPECFTGSSWHFVANNNKGNYTLNGVGCPSDVNNIIWSMQQDGADTYFTFKRVGDDEKAKNVTSGYRMKVVSIDDTQAHFIHEVPFENGKTSIHYYFTKQ